MSSNPYSCLSMLISRKNIKGADGAMKAARSTIEYFRKSSQDTEKLCKAQANMGIQQYSGKAMPVKVI